MKNTITRQQRRAAARRDKKSQSDGLCVYGNARKNSTKKLEHIPPTPVETDFDDEYDFLDAYGLRGKYLLKLAANHNINVPALGLYLYEQVYYGNWDDCPDAVSMLEYILGLTSESTNPDDIRVNHDYLFEQFSNDYILCEKTAKLRKIGVDES